MPSSAFRLTIPAWLILLVAVAGGGIVLLLAFQRWFPRRLPRPRRGSPGGSGGAPVPGGSPALRSALAEAEAALERREDAREAIVRLYGRLLFELSPRTGSVSTVTAEEIRQLHLQRLGVRPVVATALTRLFEVARYSSHSIDSERVAEFGVAVRMARRDLFPGAVAG